MEEILLNGFIIIDISTCFGLIKLEYVMCIYISM